MHHSSLPRGEQYSCFAQSSPSGTITSSHGWPDREGNAVEVVRFLLTHRRATVIWLVESLGPIEAAKVLGPGVDLDNLRIVRHSSLSGLTAYLTSKLVFFTHGLYLSPKPPKRKPVVNLWHGDGPKGNRASPGTPAQHSTYVVSGTTRYGLEKARHFQLPENDLLVTGNPRSDRLFAPVSESQWRRLGLDPTRPTVFYMPTYREAKAVGANTTWTDTGHADTGAARRLALTQLVQSAVAAGVQLVTKPHPLDADLEALTVTSVLSDDMVAGIEADLYQVLARADALITDYSSVWTDFLLLDRPVGFLLYDEPEYASGGRFGGERVRTTLPGPLLTGPKDMVSFFQDVVAGRDPGRRLRREAVNQLGLVCGRGSTARLFEELRLRGVT